VGEPEREGDAAVREKGEMQAIQERYRALMVPPYAIECVDEVPDPHPFVVGVKHVVYASDHCGGRLGQEVMERIPCDQCKLPGSKHKWNTVLFIRVPEPLENKLPEALCDWLRSVKEQAQADKIEGFAFLEPGKHHQLWREV
jgi:hypothetical protein